MIMEATNKILTEEERRQHQHFVIRQWRKDIAETKENFHAWLQTDAARRVRKELIEENAKSGIFISE